MAHTRVPRTATGKGKSRGSLPGEWAEPVKDAAAKADPGALERALNGVFKASYAIAEGLNDGAADAPAKRDLKEAAQLALSHCISNSCNNADRLQGVEKCINLTLDHGADPNAPNEKGYPAYHLATIHRAPKEVFELLVKRGADSYSIGFSRQSRRPPSLLAPDTQTMASLVGAGFDPSCVIKTADGRRLGTSYDLARSESDKRQLQQLAPQSAHLPAMESGEARPRPAGLVAGSQAGATREPPAADGASS